MSAPQTTSAKGHDGVCAFCGTSVHRDFVTCTGCGATWRSLVNGWGRLISKGAWPVGLLMGFVSIGVFQSFGAAAIVVCLGVSIGMVVAGAQTRKSAWCR